MWRYSTINFIDKALADKLTGDDFWQAMAAIYSEYEVRKILHRYPTFISDVITIIDYDTALQMDGLDDIINGNLSDRYLEIVDALKRCGLEHEASVLQKVKELSDTDEDRYGDEFDDLNNQLALYNDYDGFWDIIRVYIDMHLL